MKARQIDLKEFANTINGGIEVAGVKLTSMGYSSKKPRRIVNVSGRLMYQLESGSSYVMPGDILYLKNGDEVEVI